MTARRRRTASESRALILEVAAERLRNIGIEGLNIKGVAEAAGISHATLIHHFGSSRGMRDALADKMFVDLVDDLVGAMDAKVPPEEIVRNVFSAMSEGGHARLVAWRAVEGEMRVSNVDLVVAGLGRLSERMQTILGVSERSEIQNTIMLVALAGIGFGLSGPVLAGALNLNADDIEHFPEWVVRQIMHEQK